MDRSEHNRCRALQEHAAQLRLTTLLAKKDCKLLRPAQVRIAATHVFAAVNEAKAIAGQSMKDFCLNLAVRMNERGCHKDVDEPFRVHRWMIDLPNDAPVTVKAQTAKRVAALSKTTSTYLHLIGTLAEIAGRPPFDAQYELMEALDLLEPVSGAPRIHDLPEQNLSLRLNELAAVLARDLDMVGYFEDCQAVQPRLNLNTDLLISRSEDDWPFGAFWARARLSAEGWLGHLAPPLPSVKVARVPFRYLSGPFILTNDEGGTRQADGHAVAYWDLFLAIAPSGPQGVSFWLLRTSSVDLTLDGVGYPLGHSRDDLEVLLADSVTPPLVKRDGTLWKVTTLQQPFPETDDNSAEEFPSSGIPRTDILPLNAATIARWLMTPRLLVVSDEVFFETIDLHDELTAHAEGWIMVPSVAQSVERAMRNGRLRADMAAKLEVLRPQLAALKADWVDTACAADEALRAKHQHYDLGEQQ